MDLTKAYDLASLAAILDCSAKQLGYYIYKRELTRQYKQFRIKKRSGGHRTIRAPATNLKIIQRSIVRELSKLVRFKPCVTGFVKGRDIKRNASIHVGQRHVLNIDLQDFFGTINYGRVYGLLTKKPHNIAPKVGAALAKACTLENVLPQGAPTSPILSNLVCAKMDAELNRYAMANKCVYSRYADDLTFSTNRQFMPMAALNLNSEGMPVTEIAKSLRAIIESNGFTINEKKLRLSSRDRRQVVTGLVVNKRVNVRRSAVREVRAILHAWEKFGLVGASKIFNEKYNGNGFDFESVVRGKIGFIGQIRGRPDEIFKKLALKFNQLAIGGKIRTALSNAEIADQAVWVIEHDGDTQGTAFFLEGAGIVTCAHCLGANPFVYHPADHTKHFPVKVKTEDSHRDLAVLEIPAELKNVVPLSLHKGNASPNGADIILLGYPNHFAAAPVRVEGGKLIRTFSKSAVSYLEISPKIIGGNSGGPVLNDKHQVIGVAVLGMSGSTKLTSAEFLAVNATELAALLT
jgi:RNA-directed DNA polymerase